MSNITSIFNFSHIARCFEGVSSLTRSTHFISATFQRTWVNKLDAAGQPRLLEVIDLRTRNIVHTPMLSYIEDISTGDLYLDEVWHILAIKCAAVALGIPFYAVLVEVYYLIKTPLLLTALAFDMIQQVGKNLYEQKCNQLKSSLLDYLIETKTALTEGIWKMVSTPFYAIGMEFAAIYGIFDQYSGRKAVAAIEYSWQNHTSYKEQGACLAISGGENDWETFFTSLKKMHVNYLAKCFQVKANINDRHIRVVCSKPL